MSGRPPKERLDYSSWDVSILDNDQKIDELIDAQGIAAFTVYFYLCQKAYGSTGYYLKWGYSFCATVARKLGKGASADYVKNVVDKCFQCCLFDKRLFDLHGILTSRGIQKHYWLVAKTRTVQHIIKDFWLLEDEECPGIIFDTQNSDYEALKLNYDSPKLNYETQKESKGKKSKVNKSKEEEKLPDAASAAADKIIRKYENLIGLATPAVAEGIDFCLAEGMEEALIIRIMEYACEQNKRSWQYINAVLLGNLKEEIKTLAAYNRRQAERMERMEQTKVSRRTDEKKDGAVKKSRFNNYTDTNKHNYSKLEEEILKEMLEGNDD